jgi:uncharacterized metal-binding protein
MPEEHTCACEGSLKLVFACSGAADVGAIADQAARRISRDGAGSMFCLAGIGGRVPGIMKTTEAADAVLAIDGCPLDCAAKTLEEAGFAGFERLRVTDLGMEKGRAAVTEERVALVAEKAAGILAATS